MGNLLLWLIAVELLGLAALPLMAFLCRSFPDRGYGLSKITGLLLVGFLNFWLGSVVSLANYPVVLWALAALVLVAGLALYRLGWISLPDDRRSVLTTVLVEELIFLVAFVGWALVRMQNPAIYGTEKPMDFMLLQVSGMSHSFPPPDAWLAGHTVNYYYLGYAIFAMLGNMAGVAPRYGFNLANITIFALGCTGAYSLALALVKSRLWAIGGTIALMIGGDLDGVGQVITQIQNGTLSLRGLNLWCSTRIIGGGCNNYHTITEFPIFSMIWNDLHPHVMALPFALLAIAVAFTAVLDAPEYPEGASMRWARLALAAIAVGALYPINSWDFPTYLVLALGAMLIGTYRRAALTRNAALEILALIPLSVLVYLPYYLTVHLAGQGIGFQANPSDLREVLTVIGALLIPAAILALWRAIAAVLDPDRVTEERPIQHWLDGAPPGWGYLAAGAIALLFVVLPARTDVLFLGVVACAAYAIYARIRREAPEMLLALWLTLLGALVLFVGDYVYLRDIFAGGANYRMNTVFKLYYQAWLLLSPVAVFTVASVWRALPAAGLSARRLWAVAAACLACAVLVYPIFAIPSQSTLQSIPTAAAQAHTTGLDGLAYLNDIDPAEYQAIAWIRAHTTPTTVIAEASGTDAPSNLSSCGEYWVCPPTQSYNKVSALTGRPTILGWPGSHESLWRGAATDSSAAALLAQRERDIHTLFTATSAAQASAILRKYDVRYVYVGPVERATYGGAPGARLANFARFLRVAYANGDVTIYSV
jgi:YYY domain-containing protein